jgi:hypothetical protein
MLLPQMLQANNLKYPDESQWPSTVFASSPSLELKAQEDVFAYTQLIIRGLYRQPLMNTTHEESSFIPQLLSEWSQLCLLQIETPTKTSCSLNSGIGYRLKLYQMYSHREHERIHHIQPTFLMPFTLSTTSSFKNWDTWTLLNIELEIDYHYISRNINISHQCLEYKNGIADLSLNFYAEHTQTIGIDQNSYKYRPHYHLMFMINADFY